MECLHQIFPLGAHPAKEKEERVEEPEGMEDAKTTVSYINMNKAPMNSQRLRWHGQGLHGSAPGPLHIYYGFQFSVFMGFLCVRIC